MAAPRLSGYKTFKKWTAKTDDGNYECRIYVRTDSSTYGPNEMWAAVCWDLDMQEYGDTPEGVRKALEKRVKANTSMEWMPYLYVEVSSSRSLEPPDPEDEDLDEEDENNDSFFQTKSGNTTAEHSMSVSIQVTELQLAETPDGDQKYREQSYYSKWKVMDGWPEVGLPQADPDERRWRFKPKHEMRALVPDTPENRQAIENIREGMRMLARKLELVLAPENITSTLRAASMKPGMPMLPLGEPSKKGLGNVRDMTIGSDKPKRKRASGGTEFSSTAKRAKRKRKPRKARKKG